MLKRSVKILSGKILEILLKSITAGKNSIQLSYIKTIFFYLVVFTVSDLTKQLNLKGQFTPLTFAVHLLTLMQDVTFFFS